MGTKKKYSFYDGYLKAQSRADFLSEQESRSIYSQAKEDIVRGDCLV